MTAELSAAAGSPLVPVPVPGASDVEAVLSLVHRGHEPFDVFP